MGIEPFLVASTVEGVMAQRLVRTICPDCRVQFEPDVLELPGDFPIRDPGTKFWRGAGCRACRETGFRGRAGIFELMVTGEVIREMCVQRLNASAIRKQALKDGMITLQQAGWRKVLQGMTTVEEVAQVTAGDVS
jgi:general secretion pathway protein E/type IV pilus assembly protein PilB